MVNVVIYFKSIIFFRMIAVGGGLVGSSLRKMVFRDKLEGY